MSTVTVAPTLLGVFGIGVQAPPEDFRNQRIYLREGGRNTFTLRITPGRAEDKGVYVLQRPRLVIHFGRMLTHSDVAKLVSDPPAGFAPLTGFTFSLLQGQPTLQMTTQESVNVSAEKPLELPMVLSNLAGPESKPFGTLGFELYHQEEGREVRIARAEFDVTISRGEKELQATPPVALLWSDGVTPQLTIDKEETVTFSIMNVHRNTRGGPKNLVTSPRKMKGVKELSPRIRVTLPPTLKGGKPVPFNEGMRFKDVEVTLRPSNPRLLWEAAVHLAEDVQEISAGDSNQDVIDAGGYVAVTLNKLRAREWGVWNLVVTLVDLPGYGNYTCTLPIEIANPILELDAAPALLDGVFSDGLRAEYKGKAAEGVVPYLLTWRLQNCEGIQWRIMKDDEAFAIFNGLLGGSVEEMTGEMVVPAKKGRRSVYELQGLNGIGDVVARHSISFTPQETSAVTLRPRDWLIEIPAVLVNISGLYHGQNKCEYNDDGKLWWVGEKSEHELLNEKIWALGAIRHKRSLKESSGGRYMRSIQNTIASARRVGEANEKKNLEEELDQRRIATPLFVALQPEFSFRSMDVDLFEERLQIFGETRRVEPEQASATEETTARGKTIRVSTKPEWPRTQISEGEANRSIFSSEENFLKLMDERMNPSYFVTLWKGTHCLVSRLNAQGRLFVD